MKDLGNLMKQAQVMQQKLQDAQARLAQTLIEGSAGNGLVRVTLSGANDLRSVVLDETLMQPGDGELVADLIVAAHADAKRKLDATSAEIMKDVAGPLAGMGGGFPGLKF
jgi:DNA-binding YbaB/EbfC family protein